MMLDGGYKVGAHWENIPGHKDKAACRNCEIWKLADEVWKQKTGADHFGFIFRT
jgi:ribonuclease HI